MTLFTKALMAFGVLGSMGLAACEEDNIVEIDTPDGEIQLEEDGDIDVNN